MRPRILIDLNKEDLNNFKVQLVAPQEDGKDNRVEVLKNIFKLTGVVTSGKFNFVVNFTEAIPSESSLLKLVNRELAFNHENVDLELSIRGELYQIECILTKNTGEFKIFQVLDGLQIQEHYSGVRLEVLLQDPANGTLLTNVELIKLLGQDY